MGLLKLLPTYFLGMFVNIFLFIIETNTILESVSLRFYFVAVHSSRFFPCPIPRGNGLCFYVWYSNENSKIVASSCFCKFMLMPECAKGLYCNKQIAFNDTKPRLPPKYKQNKVPQLVHS